MDITIGIINWNVRDLLRQCLDSIYLYTSGLNFEVILVDNNSSDASVEMVKESFPSVKIIKNNINGGFSKAINQIIKASNAEFIFICNSDIKFTQNSLLTMLEFMRQNIKVAILGPRLFNEQGKQELSFNPKCSDFTRCILDNLFFYSYIRSRIFERYLIKFLPQKLKSRLEHTHLVAWLSGAAFLLRKSATKDSGLMDEGFFIYCEDEDFCCRMNKVGWQVYYFAQTSIIHLRDKSLSRIERNLSLESAKSKLHFYRKRYNPIMVSLIKFLFFYRILLECLFSCFLYIFLFKLRLRLQKKIKDYFEVLGKLFLI